MTEINKIKIPQVFKVSGVSFYKNTIDKLKEGDELILEKDPQNKYDNNAIKILNNDKEMCGFVPKKYNFKNQDFILNELILKKFDKLTTRFKLIVHSIYKWEGPTGVEVRFDKIN